MNTERNWSSIQDYEGNSTDMLCAFLTREQWINQVEKWQADYPAVDEIEWYTFKEMLSEMDDEELMGYIQENWSVEIRETTWLKAGNECLWRAREKDVIVKILEVDTDGILTPTTDILCEYNGRTCKLMFANLYGLTEMICPKCGRHLCVSDLCTYPYVCLHCDENFYRVETDFYEQIDAKRMQIRGNLERLVHLRMTEEELNEYLSKIFDRRIKVEQGQYDEDWQGDDYFTFCVDDIEIGGYFDIYYLRMNKQDYCYITEVNVYFE